MLNFMRLQLKWLFLFAFLLLLLVESSSGLELGVSPPRIVFDLTENAERCAEIKLISSERTLFMVKDYWTNESRISRNISDYSDIGREIGINAKYLSNVFIENSKNFEVCFLANNEGFYQGVLLFEPEGKNLVLGVWVLLEVSREEEKADYSKTLFLISEIALSLALLGLLSYLVIK